MINLQVDEVVYGGGIAGLLYSYFRRVPVIMHDMSPLPLCAFLHDTESSRWFLRQLGIEPMERRVTHGVFWNGKMASWPGSEASHEAYFRKSRMTEEASINKFSAAKGASSQSQIARMSQVYVELYQHLSAHNLIIKMGPVDYEFMNDIHYIMEKFTGRRVDAKKLKLAAPPEAFRYKEIESGDVKPHTCFDIFETEYDLGLPEILYVCDERLASHRVSRLAPRLHLIEHSAVKGKEKPVALMRAELLALTGTLGVIHLNRRVIPGFYERKYDLPPSVELVGRAATGVPLLTHHVIEQLIGESSVAV
jgi:hypothetical protein